MFPIRDHNPSGKPAYVRNGLILANIVTFVLYWYLLPSDGALGQFFFDWGLVPARLMEEGAILTIFSSMFLHGGWMHLLGNVWFLFLFGDNIEEELGHQKFLMFYLLSGVAAAAFQVISAPYSTVPMVGASGAIAGVMGGYLLMFPKARIDILFFFIIFFRIFPIPAWIVLGIWLGIQIFSGVSVSVDGSGGGVAYWAHIGGFLAGALMLVPLWMRRGGRDFWVQTKGHPPHPIATYPLRKTSIPAVRRR